MTDPVLALQVEVRERFAAPRERVFDLLVDVARMAGLGPEHVEARWRDGDGPALGAVFLGRNARGDLEWEVPCTVVALDRPSSFGWTVGDPAQPTTTWTYDLRDDGDGTVVVQRVEHGPGRSYLRQVCEQQPERAEQLVDGRARELEADMRSVLRAAAAQLA